MHGRRRSVPLSHGRGGHADSSVVRSHGFSIWSLIALGCGYAMWTTGADFPFWFVIALLASLPLQLLVGWWFGRRPSRDPR